MASNSFFDGSNIIITGGIGFIGSNLASRLVKQGAHVTLVDSLIPEYGGNLYNIHSISNSVNVNISDVRDEHSLRFLVQKQDYMFNLAGQTSHMDSMSNPITDLEINAKAQLSILETCRKYNPKIKVIFASTRQVYGKPDYLPVDENHPLRPVDINGINKIAGEWYHVLYNNVHGIRSCALRLTNTYGPCMRIMDARQTFVGIWIRLLIEGSPFEVWEGGQLRDFNYVEDCVNALLLAAENEQTNGKVFNLGHQNPVSLKKLADILIGLYGSGSYTVHSFPDERKKIDIGDYYSDFSSFESVTGWKPIVDIHEGMSKTIEYYKANLAHYI